MHDRDVREADFLPWEWHIIGLTRRFVYQGLFSSKGRREMRPMRRFVDRSRFSSMACAAQRRAGAASNAGWPPPKAISRMSLRSRRRHRPARDASHCDVWRVASRFGRARCHFPRSQRGIPAALRAARTARLRRAWCHGAFALFGGCREPFRARRGTFAPFGGDASSRGGVMMQC